MDDTKVRLAAPEWPETARVSDGHYYTRNEEGQVLVYPWHVAELLAQGYRRPAAVQPQPAATPQSK